MSLGYEFAPIDVSIMTHPKAFAAGVEAMGLWLWGMTFAKQHRTNGALQRPAVLGAWGGKRNIMLAKRLVDAGLWIAKEDGGWEIHNFEKKSPARSTLRVRKHRQSKAAAAASETQNETDETPRETQERAFQKHSSSLSPSPSGSDLLGGAGGGRALRPTEPLTDARREAFESLTMSVPARPIEPEWSNFVDDRIKRGAIFGSEGAIDADWRKWVRRGNDFAAERRKNQQDRAGPRGIRQPHDTGWLERMKKTGTGWDF